MVISQTPLRIEFTGGSDLPAFTQHEEGAIVNVTIDKYVYVMVKQLYLTQNYNFHLIYDKIERAKKVSLIKDPLIKNALNYLKVDNLNFVSWSDLFSKSGLGSSGSFLVGFLNAIYKLQNKKTSAKKLAGDACHIEMNLAKVRCGAQDQHAASFGGLRLHKFHTNGTTTTKLINCNSQTRNRLQNSLLLFYTGERRSSSGFLDNLWTTLETSSRARKLMCKRVELSKLISKKLSSNSLSSFGEILDEEWRLKKEIAPIETNPTIDRYYNLAKESGAKGGKLVGAGGGGFLLFYAPKSAHERITSSLKPLQNIPFKLTSKGSQIIYSR
jgi:D-glycero-alpha-D-manno-heptose-7-phosphate kinase